MFKAIIANRDIIADVAILVVFWLQVDVETGETFISLHQCHSLV